MQQQYACNGSSGSSMLAARANRSCFVLVSTAHYVTCPAGWLFGCLAGLLVGCSDDACPPFTAVCCHKSADIPTLCCALCAVQLGREGGHQQALQLPLSVCEYPVSCNTACSIHMQAHRVQGWCTTGLQLVEVDKQDLVKLR